MILTWRDFVWSMDADGAVDVEICGLIERFADFDTAAAWCAAFCARANA